MMSEVKITEVTEVRRQADLAVKFAVEIGEKLHAYADENDLCNEYNDWLEGFSNEVRRTEVYKAFYEVAKRDAIVERSFELSVTVYITPDDYEYDSLQFRDSMSVTGEYRMPESIDVTGLADLDDERVEHIGGTNLQEWFDGLDQMDVSVESSEDDLQEG